jgi:DNA-binding MarR family transcriptional regulator
MESRDAFSSLLLQITRQLGRIHREQICCADLTLQQFQALRRIQDSDHPTPSALAAELGIDLSTASRNLTRLERDGYLARSRHEGDGRSVIVRLTRKGRRALENLTCDERDTLAALYDRLPREQRTAIVGALSMLAQTMCGEGAACDCRPGEPGAADQGGRVLTRLKGAHR